MKSDVEKNSPVHLSKSTPPWTCWVARFAADSLEVLTAKVLFVGMAEEQPLIGCLLASQHVKTDVEKNSPVHLSKSTPPWTCWVARFAASSLELLTPKVLLVGMAEEQPLIGCFVGHEWQ